MYWEAMLKGSKLRPQAFVSMFDGVGTCAVGAMYEGIYGSINRDNCTQAWNLVKELDEKFKDIKCPICQSTKNGLGTIIWQLNDQHQWSRENIAYFVRSIEVPNYKVPIVEKKELVV